MSEDQNSVFGVFGCITTHHRKISNTGKSTLYITEVKANCGCASTILGKPMLEPGESTGMEIAFKPGNASGIIHKSVLVFSDDPTHPKLTVHFSADVLPSEKPQIRFHGVERASEARSVVVQLPVPEGQQGLTFKGIHLGDVAYFSVYPVPDSHGAALEIRLDGPDFQRTE